MSWGVNEAIKVRAIVPGGIYTDLMRSGIISEPYYGFNDVNYEWIALEDWTFYRSFIAPKDLLEQREVTLVAHGIDTACVIVVNGVRVLNASNMFVRYEVSVKSVLKGIAIHRWWPVGYGQQSLYTLQILVSVGDDLFEQTVRIGFRTVQLNEDMIQGFDTATAFYFVVNDIPVYAKGSNWVPPDIFPERITNDYVKELLLSVKEANMNMLRVWAGGVYETDYFYSLADELGILIWQDMMFSASLYPADRSFLQSVATEVQQQVRRLQHHPSIVVWAGNNENEDALASGWWVEVKNAYDLYRTDYIKLYIGVVKTVVEAEDKTRPFVSSTPSDGRKTAENGWISSTPNGEMNGDRARYAARIIGAYFCVANTSRTDRPLGYDMVSYLTQRT
ncbi:beta-mannosidase-like [Rhipicephalus sanguineus]|uniref:beta-mannosidase-like n=1 Tax=Rhipicephalus sanguineus TaxID=34632 RepID=UPI0020C23818|nr:beta-mannosidase-like [Rhipicephalus sanguineus]